MLPNQTDALQNRARQDSTQSRNAIRSDISRRSALIYFILFAVALTALILHNSNWNAIIGDTLLLISDFEMLQRFSSFFTNANANPLQALFDIFPSGHRLDAIPNVVGAALFGPGMHIAFFYAFSAVLLTLAVAALARTIGARWGIAVIAGVAMPFMI